ncbi:MAG: hypothetical protein KJ922_01770, partial [Nanoarchaeota archaeon]|nr:hypothetical protein [Nanoarchaeota archaeon]
SLVKRLVQTTFTEAPSAAAIEGRLVESNSRREFYDLVTGDLKLLTQKARYQSWANQRHKTTDAMGQAYVFLEDLADKLDLNDVQVAATALKQGLDTNDPKVRRQLGKAIVSAITTTYIDNGSYVNFLADNVAELTGAAKYGIIRKDLVEKVWSNYQKLQ